MSEKRKPIKILQNEEAVRNLTHLLTRWYKLSTTAQASLARMYGLKFSDRDFKAIKRELLSRLDGYETAQRYPGLPVDAEYCLLRNDYIPYLPDTGYHVNLTDYDYSQNPAVWKQRSDRVMTPLVITAIYENLYKASLIPPYVHQEDFFMASYGSSIPTHEQLIFDLDRTMRSAPTHVVSIDDVGITSRMANKLTHGQFMQPRSKYHLDGEDSHFYIPRKSNEVMFPDASMDLKWDYRGALCFSLETLMYYRENMPADIIAFHSNQAASLMRRHYVELKPSGTLVLDMPELNAEDLALSSVPLPTGTLFMDFEEDIGVKGMFKYTSLGEGKERVLALTKK